MIILNVFQLLFIIILLLVSLGPPACWAPESFLLFSSLSGWAVMELNKDIFQDDGKYSYYFVSL